MNCTCGRTGEYLLPCVHICRVIDKNEYFETSMFHVRWQKLFNFSMSNKVMEDSMINVLPVLTEIAKETRRNHFDAKGKYKGVPIQSSNFIQDIKDFTPELSDRAMFLLDHFQISQIKPILSGSYCQSDYEKI